MASVIRDKLSPRFELDRAAGQSPAAIHVRNLQTILTIGKDAWGRVGKSQPVLISTSVFLTKPFESASDEDAVTNSTIHYGILSKRILEASALFSPGRNVKGQYESRTLRKLIHCIYQSLTQPLDDGGDPILSTSVYNLLELSIMLPKGSLIGTGVSLTFAGLSNIAEQSTMSMNLALHNLRIPTLIGVNPNERLAKQIVVANVEIDGYGLLGDVYCELEQVVVKTIEESSFQTLEALATHVCRRIIRYFLLPHYREREGDLDEISDIPNVKICLEKPTAVTMADAPVIELAMSARDSGLWELCPITKVPFPLSSTLDHWISSQ
ncbi:Dihydroneopterin aldolase-domain-containing protein [Tricladium varicosporioides]|nr:Dihydroneopterin aldolase-domain-containing protein [Hymenoscyphus varicosporioides]